MNLILCPKGKNKIAHFVKNAIKRNNDVFGDNIKLYGVKEKTWDFIWTDDEVEETIQDDKKVYTKGRKDINVLKLKIEINSITKEDIKNLLNLTQSSKQLTLEEMDFCLKSISAILLTELKINNK